MKKTHKLNKILSLLVVITVLGSLTLYTHTVRSSALQNMSGYAWGGDWTDQNNNGIQELNPNNVPYEPTGGVGWISFNCTSGGNCGSNDYGVNIEANGDLVGYAWSSNYGWLKFGGLGGFPSWTGVSTGNARLNGNQLEGWARFCAGAADPISCDGTVSNPSNGGWDGWLSLKGPGYGVTLEPSTGILSGFAWGGNDGGKNIVGWVNFSTDFSDVIYIPVTGPTVTLSASPVSVPTGGHTTLSWQGANLITSSTGCTAVGPDGWDGARPSPNGSFVTPSLNTDGPHTYTIQCMGTNGEMSPVSSVTVTVGVALDFYAEPSPVYSNNGYQTVLHWTVSPSNGDLHDCQATSTTPGENQWNGADIDDPTPSDPSASFGPVYVPQNPTNFTITCKNAIEQNVTESILVHRSDLPESVGFYWDTVICNSGLCTTTLSWELTNADSCIAYTQNPTDGTGWGGDIQVTPNTGNQPGVVVPAIAPEFTTYVLRCTMDSGAEITKELFLNNETGASQPPIYQEN